MDLVSWIESNPGEGFVTWMLIYILGIGLMLPEAIFQITTSYLCFGLFGWEGFPLAMFICYICGLAGQSLSFKLSREMFDSQLRAIIKRNSKVRAFNLAVKRQSFKVVVLVRICPIMPNTVMNYFLGILKTDFK
jgi:uncharacterized membrane protein YdjX (TVP38/TMEM64 family)